LPKDSTTQIRTEITTTFTTFTPGYKKTFTSTFSHTTKTTYYLATTPSTSTAFISVYNHTSALPSPENSTKAYMNKVKTMSFSSTTVTSTIIVKTSIKGNYQDEIGLGSSPTWDQERHHSVSVGGSVGSSTSLVVNHGGTNGNIIEEGSEEIGVTGVTYKEVIVETRPEQDNGGNSLPTLALPTEEIVPLLQVK